jgi:hypothetical protein
MHASGPFTTRLPGPQVHRRGGIHRLPFALRSFAAAPIVAILAGFVSAPSHASSLVSDRATLLDAKKQ